MSDEPYEAKLEGALLERLGELVREADGACRELHEYVSRVHRTIAHNPKDFQGISARVGEVGARARALSALANQIDALHAFRYTKAGGGTRPDGP